MDVIEELRHNLNQISHHHFFLGVIGAGTPFKINEHIATLSTDSHSVFVNPDLLSIKPFDDPAIRRFALAHILLHRALNHPFRLPPPHVPDQIDYKLWALAQDIVVNNLVLSMQTVRITSLSSKDKRDKELKTPLFKAPRKPTGKIDLAYDAAYAGWSAERIYVDLQSKTTADITAAYGSMPTKGKAGKPTDYHHRPVTETPIGWESQLDTHIYYDATTPEAQDEIVRWDNCTVSAISLSKSCGHGTGDVWRQLTSNMGSDPTLDAAVNEILVAMEQAEYNWNKLQRRWLPDDLYFPSLVDDKGAELVVGIDVSGSIGKKELHEFWMIIRGLLLGGMKLKLHLLSCDATLTSIHHVSWDEPESISNIKDLPGGGGTDFRPVFEWAVENAPQAQGILFFTDLCGVFPEEAPACPVFWLVDCALKHSMAVPFGQVIFYQPGSLKP